MYLTQLSPLVSKVSNILEAKNDLSMRRASETVHKSGTVDRSPVEGMGHRINQECRLLHLPPNHPENPQEWKESV